MKVTFNIEVEEDILHEEVPDHDWAHQRRLEERVIAAVSSIFKKKVDRDFYLDGVLQCSFRVALDEIADVEGLVKEHSYEGTDQIITGVEYTVTRDFNLEAL